MTTRSLLFMALCLSMNVGAFVFLVATGRAKWWNGLLLGVGCMAFLMWWAFAATEGRKP